jgi:hypothetical protein
MEVSSFSNAHNFVKNLVWTSFYSPFWSSWADLSFAPTFRVWRQIHFFLLALLIKATVLEYSLNLVTKSLLKHTSSERTCERTIEHANEAHSIKQPPLASTKHAAVKKLKNEAAFAAKWGAIAIKKTGPIKIKKVWKSLRFQIWSQIWQGVTIMYKKYWFFCIQTRKQLGIDWTVHWYPPVMLAHSYFKSILPSQIIHISSGGPPPDHAPDPCPDPITLLRFSKTAFFGMGLHGLRLHWHVLENSTMRSDYIQF